MNLHCVQQISGTQPKLDEHGNSVVRFVFYPPLSLVIKYLTFRRNYSCQAGGGFKGESL